MNTEMTCYESFAEVTEDFYCSAVDVLKILVRTNMDGEVISRTIDEVYLFQTYLESHSITLMADDQKLTCICID